MTDEIMPPLPEPKTPLFHVTVPTRRVEQGIEPVLPAGVDGQATYAADGQTCVVTVYGGTAEALGALADLPRLTDAEVETARQAFAAALQDGTFKRLNGLKEPGSE